MKTPYVPPLTASDGGRPMAGDQWVAVNGMALSADEPVEVGASTYLAGERISVGFRTSIPELLGPGANIFTESAELHFSVANMPPVLAARILNLQSAVVSILRGGASPEVLVEAWKHIDGKTKEVAIDGGA